MAGGVFTNPRTVSAVTSTRALSFKRCSRLRKFFFSKIFVFVLAAD